MGRDVRTTAFSAAILIFRQSALNFCFGSVAELPDESFGGMVRHQQASEGLALGCHPFSLVKLDQAAALPRERDAFLSKRAVLDFIEHDGQWRAALPAEAERGRHQDLWLCLRQASRCSRSSRKWICARTLG